MFQLPGIFTVTPEASYDYNFPTENDNYSAQYLQDKIVKVTGGKMIGGSSNMQHMIMVRGNQRDYQRWATASGDDSWSYDSLLPYFKRSERMEDPDILESPFAEYHGTSGNLGMAREHNVANNEIIKSLQELGYEYYVDLNANVTLGVAEATFGISNGIRQSTAECYLGPSKDKTNLFIFEQTTVTKILFDDDNNAIGVEALTSNNETYKIKAKKEVIVAAGAIKTPQLLMLSGIGPQADLETLNIPVISDLPVGQALSDHVGVIVAFSLGATNETIPPANPHLFPVPTTVSFKSLDPSVNYPDCQSINLLFPHDSSGLLQLCSIVFKYNNDICNQVYNSDKGHGLLYSVVYLLQPSSTGTVSLRSSDPLDNPKITTGFFSDPADLDNLGSCLQDIAGLVNTTYFKKAESEIVDLDLEECNSLDRTSWEYWKCYGKAMSTTIWHPAASAPMGPVLDSKLRVRGVQKLRVVDASAMPNVSSGNIMLAVVALAEKAADLIKDAAASA